MITFLIIFVLVLLAVDLIVRFILEPFLVSSRKKSKVSKSFPTKFDPSVTLATETMFDGGKPHKDDEMKERTEKANGVNKE